jgi:hypothetical protein
MPNIEYRFLQIIVNPVSGDRATIALVHWDGGELRVASSFGAAPKTVTAAQKAVLKKLVRGIEEQKKEIGGTASQKLPLRLNDVLPVREGVSSSIEWTRVRVGKTRDSRKHFDELRALVHLDERVERRERPTQRKLHEELTELGRELQTRFPKAVVVNVDVQGPVHHYRSPLSWKNGKWHHAVPFEMDELDSKKLAQRSEGIFGKVNMSFDPKVDVPVVVAVLPADPVRAMAARAEADALRTLIGKGNGDVVVDDADGYLAALRGVIERDVMEA